MEEIIEKVIETPAETVLAEKEEQGLSWTDFDDNDADDSDNNSPDGEIKEVEVKEEVKNEWWQIASEKTGLKAENEEDYIKKSSSVKEVFISEKDPDIRTWKSYLSKTDKELVEAELKASGEWEKADIDEYVAKMEKNGDLKFKAKEIRAGLNKAIVSKQSDLNKKESEQTEYRRNFATTVNKNVTEKLSKTDTVLGFKVGINETDVKKWQETTGKYVNSGKLTKDIDAILKEAHDGNPEKLIELAQFLRKKDGIKKGLMQIGESKGAASILAELENEETNEKPVGERNPTDKKTSKGWFTDPDLKKQN